MTFTYFVICFCSAYISYYSAHVDSGGGAGEFYFLVDFRVQDS